MLYKGFEEINSERVASAVGMSLESLSLPKVEPLTTSEELPKSKSPGHSTPRREPSKRSSSRRSHAGKAPNILAQEIAVRLEHSVHQRGENSEPWMATREDDDLDGSNLVRGRNPGRYLDRSYDNVVNQLTHFLNSLTFIEREALELHFIVGLSIKDCRRVMSKVKNSNIENIQDNINEIYGTFQISTQTEVRRPLEPVPSHRRSLPPEIKELRDIAINALKEWDKLTDAEVNGLTFLQVNTLVHALKLLDGSSRRISVQSQRAISKYVEEVQVNGLNVFWIKDTSPLFFTDGGLPLGPGVPLCQIEGFVPDKERTSRSTKLKA